MFRPFMCLYLYIDVTDVALHSMTPRTRDIVQELIFPKPLEKLSTFCVTRSFVSAFSATHQVPVLNQLNPVFNSFCLLKIHFNITLPSTHRSSELLFPSCFPTKILYEPLLSKYMGYLFPPSHYS